MDKLLPKIENHLQQNIDWVRDSDVRLIPAPGVIPDDVGFPYIGVTDRGVQISHETIGCQTQNLNVDVYIYDRLGRSSKNIKKLHSRIRDLGGLLGQDFLGIETLTAVEPVSQTGIDLLYTPKGMVIRKGIKLKYQREEYHV